MARALRIEFPGAIYHVTSRGNARQDIAGDDLAREKWVNRELKDEQLEEIRTSVERGRPLGPDPWVRRTARRLGLAFTLRGPGRPRTVSGNQCCPLVLPHGGGRLRVPRRQRSSSRRRATGSQSQVRSRPRPPTETVCPGDVKCQELIPRSPDPQIAPRSAETGKPLRVGGGCCRSHCLCLRSTSSAHPRPSCRVLASRI